MNTEAFFTGVIFIAFAVGITVLIITQLAHALGWPVTIGIIINTALTVTLIKLSKLEASDD